MFSELKALYQSTPTARILALLEKLGKVEAIDSDKQIDMPLSAGTSMRMTVS